MVLAIGGLMLLDGIGLGIEVDTPAWWLTRPVWLALLAVIAWPFIAGFGRFERPRDDRRPAPPAWRPVAAVGLFSAGLGLVAAAGLADADGLNGLALSLPILAVVIGGVGGARFQKGATS
jgi:hypothetical protein